MQILKKSDNFNLCVLQIQYNYIQQQYMMNIKDEIFRNDDKLYSIYIQLFMASRQSVNGPIKKFKRSKGYVPLLKKGPTVAYDELIILKEQSEKKVCYSENNQSRLLQLRSITYYFLSN
ncbi:hypothetical protein ABPG74_011581 [Tetrahymena malaccensis]